MTAAVQDMKVRLHWCNTTVESGQLYILKLEAEMDKKSSDKKLVSFRLPEDLLEHLRERADEENTTVTELVHRLLRQGLQTSADDRIAVLEEEVRDLRQLKQINFSTLSPVPIYTSLLPQNAIAAEPDGETKQRIASLEAQVKEVKEGITKLGDLGEQMESIAKLEAMMEKVLTGGGSERFQSKHQADVDEGAA